jgi:hypothetical protein
LYDPETSALGELVRGRLVLQKELLQFLKPFVTQDDAVGALRILYATPWSSGTLVEADEGVQKMTSRMENPHFNGHHGQQK